MYKLYLEYRVFSAETVWEAPSGWELIKEFSTMHVEHFCTSGSAGAHSVPVTITKVSFLFGLPIDASILAKLRAEATETIDVKNNLKQALHQNKILDAEIDAYKTQVSKQAEAFRSLESRMNLAQLELTELRAQNAQLRDAAELQPVPAFKRSQLSPLETTCEEVSDAN